MNDKDLNNFFKPAKELLKTLPKQNKIINIEDLKKTMVHPLILKNANKTQRQKLNQSIEEYSRHYQKSTNLPLKNFFDREFLYHENLSLKTLLNKKNTLIDELRISNLKMDERNEKNLRDFGDILEDTKRNFLSQSNANFKNRSKLLNTSSQIYCNTENNTTSNNISNSPKENAQATQDSNQETLNREEVGKSMNLEDTENSRVEISPIKANLSVSMKRAKEVTLINGLRRQIIEYKLQNKNKDEELEKLKNCSKCTKYSELESHYQKQSDELTLLRDQVEILSDAVKDKDWKLKNVNEESQNTKSLLHLYKARFEDAQETISRLQNESKELKDKCKELEDKHKNIDYKLQFTKNLVKDREKEIQNYKQESQLNENFQTEKLNLEKKIADLSIKCSSYKLEVKTKSNKIQDLEKKLTILQEEYDLRTKNMSKKLKSAENSINGYKEEKEKKKKKNGGDES